MTDDDYGRRVDEISNCPEARELLQAVMTMASFYFAFLEQRGVHVGSITIVNHEAPNGNGPVISKYIDSESLRQGGSLTSRH